MALVVIGFAWYVNSVAYTAVPAWTATTAITAGTVRRQTAPAAFSEAVFVCIVAGTTGGTEPSVAGWTTPTRGNKVTDGGVTWQDCTGQAGVNGDLTYCPSWTAVKNSTPFLGYVIKNNAGTFLFICSTSGLTGNGAEPTWNTTAGVTTVDNAATWTCIGAVGNFTAYKAPHARIRNAQLWAFGGDTFFVSDNHAATSTGANNLSTNPSGLSVSNQSFYYCVDHLVVPPTYANLKTTASEACTGAATLTLGGGYHYGITYKDGSGANFVGLNISPGSVPLVLENCSLQGLDTSASGAKIAFTSTGARSFCRLVNTTVKFGNVGDSIAVDDSFRLRWEDTPGAILSGIAPNTLFGGSAAYSGSVECEGVDFSGAASGCTLYGTAATGVRVDLINCKLPTAYALGVPAAPGGRIDLTNCDSGATNYQHSRATIEGSQVVETTIVRTGGASDGTTPISWKIGSTYNSWYFDRFICKPISIWNAAVAINRVVTLAGIWNPTANNATGIVPNNDDISIYVEYLGSSGSPISSLATNAYQTTLASNSPLPADSTSAWDSVAAARLNTHAYVVGNPIKLASNPGRLFFCTTAGTTAASEPVGYASAVDGGSVTDGTAVFRAGGRFILTVTLSSPQPAMVGYIRAYIKANSNYSPFVGTFYVDPLITLS